MVHREVGVHNRVQRMARSQAVGSSIHRDRHSARVRRSPHSYTPPLHDVEGRVTKGQGQGARG